MEECIEKGRGAECMELPCLFLAHSPPSTSMSSLTHMLSEPHPLGVFIKTVLCRHDWLNY